MISKLIYDFSEEISEDVLHEFEIGIKDTITSKYVGNHSKELLISCMKQLIRLYYFHKKINDPIRKPYCFAVTITEGFINEFEEKEFHDIAITYLNKKQKED